MKTRSRMTTTALVLAPTLGGTLAACGGSDDAASSTGKAGDTAATEPGTGAGTDSDSGDGEDGKPSRDDVVAGYTKMVTTAGGSLPDDIVEKVVTCFVDELYEPASAKTLQAIADADASGVDLKDAKLFSDAGTTCMTKMGG